MSETLWEDPTIFERCRQRHPTVRLSADAFRIRMDEIIAVAHRDHAEGSAAEEKRNESSECSRCLLLLGQLHYEDLYLALACATGDRVAWECFIDDYLPLLKRFAAQACRSVDTGDDLAHELVTDLLGQSAPISAAPCPDSPGERHAAVVNQEPGGRLAGYNGRGSLAGWLRVAVAHAAIDRFRREKKLVFLNDLPEHGAGDPGTSREHDEPGAGIDASWGPVLARALEDEISKLEARDRLILNLYYLQGVPLKALGHRFGVHEATASRWLDRLREGLRKSVERRLRKEHGLRPRDLKSLWRHAGETGALDFGSLLEESSAEPVFQKKGARENGMTVNLMGES